MRLDVPVGLVDRLPEAAEIGFALQSRSAGGRSLRVDADQAHAGCNEKDGQNHPRHAANLIY